MSTWSNPGELFGMARALQRTPYPANAVSVIESLAVSWPSELWDAFVARHPIFGVRAMQMLGGRLQEAHSRMREMATEDAERRVAHAVLRLAHQAGSKGSSGIRIDFPLSRQDIAEMTSTTLHTVSRILSTWETAELIKGERQRPTQ